MQRTTTVSEEHFYSLRDQRHSSAREEEKEDQVINQPKSVFPQEDHTHIALNRIKNVKPG
jgi:hypothetical protein